MEENAESGVVAGSEAPAEPRRIRVIPVFVFNILFAGLGIAALGYYSKNKLEQVGGVLLFLAFCSFLIFMPMLIPGSAAFGVLAVVVLRWGSFIYIVARLFLLSRAPSARLAAF